MSAGYDISTVYDANRHQKEGVFMSNPMERQDVKEAFLASLDALAEDKKAAGQALARITTITEQTHEVVQRSHEVAKQSNEVAQRSHEVAKQSNEVTKRSHEVAKQSNEVTKRSHEVIQQIHETIKQIREIANLMAKRLEANDKQHETLIRLVKALDTDR